MTAAGFRIPTGQDIGAAFQKQQRAVKFRLERDDIDHLNQRTGVEIPVSHIHTKRQMPPEWRARQKSRQKRQGQIVNRLEPQILERVDRC